MDGAPAPAELPDARSVAFAARSPARNGLGGYLAFGAVNGRFIGRAGLEYSRGTYWLVGAAVDTAYGERVTLAVNAEAMTPSWFLLAPSFGFSVGLPVQVEPELQLGVRGTGTIHFPLVGIVLNVDHFPDAAEERWRVGVMGRLSL